MELCICSKCKKTAYLSQNDSRECQCGGRLRPYKIDNKYVSNKICQSCKSKGKGDIKMFITTNVGSSRSVLKCPLCKKVV